VLNPWAFAGEVLSFARVRSLRKRCRRYCGASGAGWSRQSAGLQAAQCFCCTAAAGTYSLGSL